MPSAAGEIQTTDETDFSIAAGAPDHLVIGAEFNTGKITAGLEVHDTRRSHLTRNLPPRRRAGNRCFSER